MMLDIIQAAAREGAKIVMESFHAGTAISHLKTNLNNILTDIDSKAQDMIEKYIINEASQLGIAPNELGFIGEENLARAGKKYTVVIDPIDGTANFASGIERFCVAIAVFTDNVVTHAAVFDPIHDVMWAAEKGSGAFKIDRTGKTPMTVSGKNLSECVVTSTFSSKPEIEAKLYKYIEAVFPHVRSVRIFGAVAMDLAQIAEGKIGASFTNNPLWDVAAGSLLITEAGGMCADFNGDPLEIDCSDSQRRYWIITGSAVNTQKIAGLCGNLV